jgi:hypothetical protein
MRLIENLSVLSIEDFLIKLRNFDIFISCGSFEERCKRSSDIFLDKKVKIGTSIIFNYKETDPENKKEEYIREMKSNLEEICNYVHIFDTESVSLPSDGIKKFLMFLKEKNIDFLKKQIISDITVFTKGYFFLLFKVLKEKFNLHEFHVVYTEPEKYKSKSTDTNEIILTEGLDRVESIPGFAGSSINYKDVLIVILGFEGKRSMEVFNSVNPELTFAVNGFPSFQPGWHKISLEANLLFLQESGASEHLFFAPAVDPFETRNTISQIVKEIEKNNKNTNIIISPLGTKLQAFGVFLYVFENRKVKVIYPFPSIYKPDYSYKYGPTWIFKVNLNKYEIELK